MRALNDRVWLCSLKIDSYENTERDNLFFPWFKLVFCLRGFLGLVKN